MYYYLLHGRFTLCNLFFLFFRPQIALKSQHRKFASRDREREIDTRKQVGGSLARREVSHLFSDETFPVHTDQKSRQPGTAGKSRLPGHAFSSSRLKFPVPSNLWVEVRPLSFFYLNRPLRWETLGIKAKYSISTLVDTPFRIFLVQASNQLSLVHSQE